MLFLLTTYPHKSRECKRFITGLVKSGIAGCVQKIEYVKSYYMREWVLKQEQEKILFIKLDDSKKSVCIAYFTKNHPYDIPEMLWLRPEDVNVAYEKRIARSAAASQK